MNRLLGRVLPRARLLAVAGPGLSLGAALCCHRVRLDSSPYAAATEHSSGPRRSQTSVPAPSPHIVRNLSRGSLAGLSLLGDYSPSLFSPSD